MNVLAFDCCFGAMSVAVRWQSARGEWLLREAYEERSTGHAERLMPMIGETMEAAGLAFGDIARIAVTVGPGSFTGVRVGIAAARGLALATGKPVVGLTSLAAMALRAHLLLRDAVAGRPMLVAADARRGMAYAQPFDGEGVQTGDAQLLTPADAARLLAPGPALIVGPAAATVAEAAVAQGIAVEAALPALQPHARQLAMLAHGLAPLDPVAPLYLRAPDVKPQGDKSIARAGP